MSSRKIFTVLVAALLLWAGARWLLPIVLPFFLAALLALAAEPLVRFFHRKANLPRTAATGIGVTMTLVLLALLAGSAGTEGIGVAGCGGAGSGGYGGAGHVVN